MTPKDKFFGAIAWWIGLVGLIGLLLRPPLHPAARVHCLGGLIFNLAFFVLGWVLFPGLSRALGADLFSAVRCAVNLIFLSVAIANTAAALTGRGIFFSEVSG